MELNYLIRQLLCMVLLTLLVSCTSISGVEYPKDRVGEISVGMAGQEVKNILGEPYTIERYVGGEKWIWSYSSSREVHSFVVTVENGYVRSLSGFKDSKN